jgi:tetratricopeptide (TPR) repeat protein
MNPVIRVTLLVAALLAVVIAGSYFYSRLGQPVPGESPPPTSPSPSPPEVDLGAPLSPAVSAGLAALQDSRLEDARASFESVPATDPGYLMALQYLGQVCAQMGDWKGAREAFENLVSIQPDAPEVLAMLAQVQYSLDDFDAAELTALRALEGGSVDPMLRYDIALYRVAQDRTAEAINTYERAIEADAGRTEILKALQRLAALHDRHPELPSVHYALAYFARRLARQQLEITELEHYLATEPTGQAAENARRRLAEAKATATH